MYDDLQIIYWNNPILSTICDKVEDNEFGPKLELFSEQLLTTMVNNDGVGLAAPQIGIAKRVFVMKFMEQGYRIAVCNPEIKFSGKAITSKEGCLSLPQVFGDVKRAEHAEMSYRDPGGKYCQLFLSQMDARIAAHEEDHLNGIMFFNYQDQREQYGARMTRQMSRMVLRQWEKQKFIKKA